MTEDNEKPSLDVKLSDRELPSEVRRRREAFQSDNERLEAVAKPRMEGQLRACRMALEQLKEWHRGIADKTDLDLAGHTRGSAIWLLSGRSLGLLESLIVLAEAGIDTEAMVMGRALHEADQMLLVFRGFDEEDLVRKWLEDEGQHVMSGRRRPARRRRDSRTSSTRRWGGKACRRSDAPASLWTRSTTG